MLSNVSFSALNLWLLCGEACRRTYWETPIPPGVTAWRGRSGHESIEVNNTQKVTSAIDLKLDYLQDYCRDKYVHGIKDEGVYMPREDIPFKNKILNQGLNQALNAVATYKEKIAPKLQPAKVEQYIRTDVGLEMPLSGRIDTQDINDVIIDFKIGKRKPKNFEHKDMQPTFYLLLKYLTTKEIPKFKYNIIPANGDIQELPTTRTFNDFHILMDFIKLFIKDIKAGIFRPAQPGHWKCSERWCGYHPTCKYVGN